MFFHLSVSLHAVVSVSLLMCVRLLFFLSLSSFLSFCPSFSIFTFGIFPRLYVFPLLLVCLLFVNNSNRFDSIFSRSLKHDTYILAFTLVGYTSIEIEIRNCIQIEPV